MARYASIDEVIASYPNRFNADKAQSVDETVYMHLTGDNGRDVAIHVHHGQLDVREGVKPDDPALTLTADAADWLAVENGQLNPMMAMMSGKVKMKGNPAFAMKFMGLFGYGG